MDFESDSDAIEISLSVPSQARIGDHVPITIMVRNPRPRTVGLASVGSEITFDIVIVRDDALVWRRLEGQTIPLALQIRMLESGASIALTDTWHATVDAGVYAVRGRIPTDAEPLETPWVEMEIVSR
jgi:hypothetical protein